jgi:hypothetical protein
VLLDPKHAPSGQGRLPERQQKAQQAQDNETKCPSSSALPKLIQSKPGFHGFEKTFDSPAAPSPPSDRFTIRP